MSSGYIVALHHRGVAYTHECKHLSCHLHLVDTRPEHKRYLGTHPKMMAVATCGGWVSMSPFE